MSKAPRQKRRRMRQAAFRLRERIRNLVDECHRKVAAFLTDNYRLIFLPTFESARMVAKAGRKFGSKTARTMLTWAHYRFQQFLKFQAKKKRRGGGCLRSVHQQNLYQVRAHPHEVRWRKGVSLPQVQP
jgi:hypothetical protein